MRVDEFIQNYWHHYILLEKEFFQTLDYVDLSDDNSKTFSRAYQKLLLEAGSEIDVVLKTYCTLIDNTFCGDNIKAYKRSIVAKNKDFLSEQVKIRTTGKLLVPWEKWNVLEEGVPDWWIAYNKVKHERTSVGMIGEVEQEYFKFANQEYTTLALAGLYQALINIHFLLAKESKEYVLTPMPGSSLFVLTGDKWNSVPFYGDYAFRINDKGHLEYTTGKFRY